jgi:hypothetical protein
MILRQATSQAVRFGPFLDSTDAVTPETGLTIAQADMQLSKDGAAFAQKNAAGNATHDTDGWYSTTLDTTDTGTVGELILQVNVTGAGPVWVRWYVVEEAVYDALYAASAAGYNAVAPLDAAGVRAAVGLASADLDTQLGNLATAAALATVDSNVDSILADTGTDGVAISSATANQIADHILRRPLASARASGDGDTVGFRSLLGAASKLVNRVAVSGTDLLTYAENDTTAIGTQAITTNASAEPITELDTA